VSRRAHFTVPLRFDGKPSAKVTIEVTDANTYFKVRPFRRKRTYEMLLADVAEIVAWRVVKAEAREKLRAKKARRAAR
jgi:hypothetical protein